jgi:type IV secretion system protein TrbL
MNDLGIIDRFTDTFSRYIDGGFGLLNGEIAFLASVLIALDITLAGLRWAGGSDSDLMAHLIRKTLYVGAFAFLINNWPLLTTVIFKSFAGLGLQATANQLSPERLMQPRFIAATGFDAAWPLIAAMKSLPYWSQLPSSLAMVLILGVSWFFVIIAFFVLAVQLLIIIIEFKLTSLAGFVLVPFGLWGKSAFLAERTLGNVISSGIKLMVLAVIIAIGSIFFREFTSVLQGHDPTLADTSVLLLVSLVMLGLGIFCPGIAAGLISGAPQLGAGSALGTAGAALGAAAIAAGGSLAALRAGTSLASGAATAYGAGKAADGTSGLKGIASGVGGMTHAGLCGVAGALANPFKDSITAGRDGALRAMGQNSSLVPSSPSEMPAWAKTMQAQQAQQRSAKRTQATTQAIKEGDRPGAPANPSLDDKE